MGEITIGRDARCNIVIDHPSVSRVHAKIIQPQQNGVYYYSDLSSNGSVVNGEKTNHIRMLIRPGDDVFLAGVVPLPWHQVLALLPQSDRQAIINESSAPGTPLLNDRLEIGWGILAFLIPPAGFIMYLAWKDTTPKRAKTAALISLISVILLMSRRFYYI